MNGREGIFEITTTKEKGELLTTEVNDASPITGGMSMTALIVSPYAAIVFAVCLIALIYYWRKVKITDRGESMYSVEFEEVIKRVQ